MPLRLVRSTSNRVLWDSCADRFLTDVADSPGPLNHPAHLWITQRDLRDSLLERAHEKGLRGWLAPPLAFFSELPQRFAIAGKPMGLLTRRRMVARLAVAHAGRLGIGGTNDPGIVRGHMMDGFLSELLPEGITPERLEQELAAVGGDDFSRRRNDWIISVYRDYLNELHDLGQFDPRSVHALLADAIDRGRLPDAIGGSPVLHIYGLHTFRSRERLLTSLSNQKEVDVILYTIAEDEKNEWDELTSRLGLETELLPADSPAAAFVQPVPDTLREYGWVALQVKRWLVEERTEPHRIAVVAREGREDTRRACAALEAAGIPCTARIRMPLSEIGALKAVLELFRGAAGRWSYRPLRNFLTSPYFRTRIDLRAIDHVAKLGRPEGLAGWATAITRLADIREADDSREARDIAVHHERLRKDADRLTKLKEELGGLEESRSEADWIAFTTSLVRDGVLGLRKLASQPVGDRWDLVRFDQRGLRQFERLLREWAELDLDPAPLTTEAWYRLLQRLLEANELALSTPNQKGVQVVEAQDAALIPYDALFLTHANDGAFPRVQMSRGVLTEEERMTLRSARLPVADRETSLRRERTLWNAAVQADETVITYRTTDPAGTPLLPSMLVPPHDLATELPRSWEPVAGLDVPDVTSAEQERRLAAIRLRQSAGTDQVIDVADMGMLRRAIVAAHGEVRRGVRDSRGDAPTAPNPWQGEIRDPFVLEEIGRRFGPDHIWSVSQLEDYATSPFVFFMKRFLRLQDLEEADEEASALVFGSVAHDILRDFYEAVIPALPPAFDSEAVEIFERTSAAVFNSREASGEWLGHPSLWPHTREEIRDRVRAYLTWELDHMAKKKERPVWCELELGSSGEPALLTGYDVFDTLQKLRFTGRIDRVDRVEAKGVESYHVLDYKTSTIPATRGYDDGSVLQGALYLHALEFLKGVSVGSGRYRAIRNPGKPANGCGITSGKDNYNLAIRIAFSIPTRVGRGFFEPARADSKSWTPWDPGIEIVRTRVKVGGSRFHG